MVILVQLLGVCITVLGIVFFTKKDAFAKYIAFWKDKKKIRYGAFGAFAFGIIFLIADSQFRMPLLITIFGVWSIIKGVILLTIPQKKIDAYLDWWLTKPASATRLLGILVVVFGIILTYAA